MNSPPHILFALAGVSLGNATRCMAVMEAMPELHCEALTFGTGAAFLERRGIPVHHLTSLFTPQGALATALALPLLLLLWAINVARAWQVLRARRPQLVVADSEYSSLIAARLLGIPVVGINQAAAVRAMWADLGSPNLRFSYFTRELPDAWFCRAFHTTYVPTFLSDADLPKRHVAVPLIVRRLPKRAPRAGVVLTMLGGSAEIAAMRFPSDATPTQIGGPNLVDDAPERLATAERAVIQGGLSSLSEVLALRLPAAVVPLRGHAEQTLHARWLAAQGAILLVEDGDLDRVWPEFLRFTPAPHELRTDGAAVLAEHLRSRVHA